MVWLAENQYGPHKIETRAEHKLMREKQLKLDISDTDKCIRKEEAF